MNIENWNFQEYQKEKKEYEKQKQAEKWIRLRLQSQEENRGILDRRYASGTLGL